MIFPRIGFASVLKTRWGYERWGANRNSWPSCRYQIKGSKRETDGREDYIRVPSDTKACLRGKNALRFKRRKEEREKGRKKIINQVLFPRNSLWRFQLSDASVINWKRVEKTHVSLSLSLSLFLFFFFSFQLEVSLGVFESRFFFFSRRRKKMHDDAFPVKERKRSRPVFFLSFLSFFFFSLRVNDTPRQLYIEASGRKEIFLPKGKEKYV